MSEPQVPAVAPNAQTSELVACWNAAGVYGDNSCEKLVQHVHCRNCPVYSAAGVQLLERALPAGYRAEWAEHFSNEKKLPEAGAISVVLFRLGTEWLALPTQAFQEVAERRQIRSLPHQRQGVVLGLANVRGELLICISLGHLLGQEGMPALEVVRASYQRLLVANWGGSRYVFPVDEVRGPQRFHADELKGPPALAARATPGFTQGLLVWRQRVAAFLDPDVLFSTLNRSLM